MRSLFGPRRPTRSVELLLTACLSPLPRAQQAWRAWQDGYDFDAVGWTEVRVLAPLSRRIAQLDPQSPLRPRIEGLARMHWTRTQVTLRETLPALSLFGDAGIPTMLLKGAAFYAEGHGPATRRLMGDVDVLVPQEDIARASDLLCANGWQAMSGESASHLRQSVDVRPGTAYYHGRHGEMDLHRTPYHLMPRDAAMVGEIWQCATRLRFAGVETAVPEPAESIVMTLSHGVYHGEGDWAVDVGHRLLSDTVDWDRLVGIARSRLQVPPVLTGLVYLNSLGIPVPEGVMSALSSSPGALRVWVKHWSGSRRGDNRRGVLRHAAEIAANGMLPRDGYDFRRRSETALPEVRPRSIRTPGNPVWIWKDWPSATAGLCASVDLPELPERGRCAMTVRVPAPPVPRRMFFEVAIDGATIARLRARTTKRTQPDALELCFEFPLPRDISGTSRLTVEARPSGPVKANEPEEAAAHAAMPFELIDLRLLPVQS